MCGIAGQFKFRDIADRELLKRMTDAMIHRGPDGEGFYFNENVGLGTRRLKVIDLETGDQPIHNQNKNVWVVFNGEIYNYKELRMALRSKGYTFYTKSDTEVIAHLYDEYGENFVEYLDGMFAIALWDERKKKLLVARDRVGEKPLYYYFDDGQFLFASEMKAVLECPDVPREIDFLALHGFFVYGRVSAPRAIFKSVKKLEPATVLTVENGVVKTRRYWSLSFREKFTGSEDEIKKELRKCFEKSVRSMMTADVPLGALLSGGVDSSAVVAMMAKNSDRPITTFSVGFKERDFSELEYARIVAKKFGTDHHEFIIEPKVLEVLPKLVKHFDEPFGDASIIPTYYVSEAARKKLIVALTGDGGDELFAGYEWFRAVKIAQKYNKLPQFLRKFLGQIGRLLPDTGRREGLIRYAHKLKKLLETQAGKSGDALDVFLNMNAGFTEACARDELYGETMSGAIKDFNVHELRRTQLGEYNGNDPLEAVLYSQFRSLLPDMFFTKVDRASMAASLETRAPFASREMVELAAKIPFDYKLRGNQTKYIFKKAMEGILPDEILYRHKKGFGIPLAAWIKDKKISANIRETVFDKSVLDLGFFNERYIKGLYERHMSGREDNATRIWLLYVFALWHREFVKNTY